MYGWHISDLPHARSSIAIQQSRESEEPAALRRREAAALGRRFSRGLNFHVDTINRLLPSFVCSIELAETEQVETDEFSQFVKVRDWFSGVFDMVDLIIVILSKASKHPPNELSVPRCYSPGKTPPPSSRAPPSPSSSLTGSSPRSLCSRPRLRRERAQDIEDGDHYSLTRCFYSSD